MKRERMKNWIKPSEIFTKEDLINLTIIQILIFKKFIITKTKSELLIVDIKKHNKNNI